jgi:hypothetical protein
MPERCYFLTEPRRLVCLCAAILAAGSDFLGRFWPHPP